MLEVESMFSSQRWMSVIYKYVCLEWASDSSDEKPSAHPLITVANSHTHAGQTLAEHWLDAGSGESLKMSLININKDRPRDREIRGIECHFMLTKGWTDSCVKCTDHLCLSWSPILLSNGTNSGTMEIQRLKWCKTHIYLDWCKQHLI